MDPIIKLEVFYDIEPDASAPHRFSGYIHIGEKVYEYFERQDQQFGIDGEPIEMPEPEKHNIAGRLVSNMVYWLGRHLARIEEEESP